MSRLPPGTLNVVFASAGALSLGVGAVAALDRNLWGIPLALGGLLLLAWSIQASRQV